MNIFLKKFGLLVTVFLTGACVLVVEVVAVRILSPYFGNTIFTFSSILGVVLAALSLGYYVGGRFADKYPEERVFFGIIGLSGVTVLGVHALSVVLLPLIGYSLSLVSGPLVISVLLFFIPSFLFGLLSPFVITLQHKRFPERGVGAVSGDVFFWSTLGSITGSIASGFYLVPRFGVDRIMIGVGVLLFVLCLIGLAGRVERKRLLSLVLLLALTVVGVSSVVFASGAEEGVLYKEDGVYSQIVVRDVDHDGRPVRTMQLDRSASGAMYLDSLEDHVFDFSQYYVLYEPFEVDVERALVIGGATYTIPRALLESLPGTQIEVVEIEEDLYTLAQEYFALPEDERLTNVVGDGRRFLHDTPHTYDYIFGDAYYSLYSIPVHLTTVEFFELVHSKLNDDGIFIMNVIGDLAELDQSLTYSMIATLSEVFPNDYYFATEGPEEEGVQNLIFVGVKNDKEYTFDGESEYEVVQKLSERRIDEDVLDLSGYTVFTDTYAPVEFLTWQGLRRVDRE